MALERCETGIHELDRILRGGIPRSNVVLLAGGSGMGKTTLAAEFLSHGAKIGENGLFVCVTEPAVRLQRNLRAFEFVDPDHIGTRMHLVDLRAVTPPLSLDEQGHIIEGPDAVVRAITTLVMEHAAKRLVVDSVTAICHRFADAADVRDFIFRLGIALSKLDCTCLLTSETPPRQIQYSLFGVEEFIADGIIFLSEMERNNDLVRTLQVMKMRGTEHSRAKFMMDLSEFGVSLAPLLKKVSDRPVLGA